MSKTMSNSIFKEGHYSLKDIKLYVVPRILKHVRIGEKAKVLDLGCGKGLLLKELESYKYEVYGVDVSEEYIQVARKIVPKAKLFIHNIDKGLPMFDNDYFDLVTLLHVIEHVESPYRVLKEVYRVLKPNRYLVLVTPNLNSIVRLALKIFNMEHYWYGFKDPSHIYLFTPRAIKHLVTRVGFCVKSIETPFRPLQRIINDIISKSGFGGEIWIYASKT